MALLTIKFIIKKAIYGNVIGISVRKGEERPEI